MFHGKAQSCSLKHGKGLCFSIMSEIYPPLVLGHDDDGATIAESTTGATDAEEGMAEGGTSEEGANSGVSAVQRPDGEASQTTSALSLAGGGVGAGGGYVRAPEVHFLLAQGLL